LKNIGCKVTLPVIYSVYKAYPGKLKTGICIPKEGYKKQYNLKSKGKETVN
jgi:hypothetical protein